MSEVELKNKLKNILNGDCAAQVYFVLRINGEFVIRIANINDKDEPELRNMFKKELDDTIINNDSLTIRSLSSSYEEDNSIYLYDYDTFPEELEIFEKFDIKEAVKLDKFNFDNDSLSDLFGYIIYLGSMYDGIVLFKKHYSISLIRQDNFLLGMVKDKEKFSKIPATDIIRLNGKVQLFKLDNKIFVTDIKMLEKNMGFNELIKKSAKEAISSISELNIVDDIDTLNDALDDFTFVKKLSKIKSTSPIFKLKIDGSAIIKFTKETAKLKGKFKYSIDGNKIKLDTKKARKDFLSLMNDGYLHSQLTNQYYEASSKDDLN